MLFFSIYDENNEVIAEKPFQNSGVTRRLWTFGHFELTLDINTSFYEFIIIIIFDLSTFGSIITPLCIEIGNRIFHSFGDRRSLTVCYSRSALVKRFNLQSEKWWQHSALSGAMGRLKTRERKTRHQIAGVEMARTENAAPKCRGGKGENRKRGTKVQGLKRRENVYIVLTFS